MHIKNLLLLLLIGCTNIAISQENKPYTNDKGETIYPFSGAELDRAYFREVQCTQDLEQALESVDELHTVVVDLNNEIQNFIAETNELKRQKDALQAEKDEKVKELYKLQTKRVKRFGIGLQTGYGIDGKIYAGVGVTYCLFQF